jgi:hypothetical protein
MAEKLGVGGKVVEFSIGSTELLMAGEFAIIGGALIRFGLVAATLPVPAVSLSLAAIALSIAPLTLALRGFTVAWTRFSHAFRRGGGH